MNDPRHAGCGQEGTDKLAVAHNRKLAGNDEVSVGPHLVKNRGRQDDETPDHHRKSGEYAEQGKPVHPSRHTFTRPTYGNAAVVHSILLLVIAAAATSRTSTRHHWACTNNRHRRMR